MKLSDFAVTSYTCLVNVNWQSRIKAPFVHLWNDIHLFYNIPIKRIGDGFNNHLKTLKIVNNPVFPTNYTRKKYNIIDVRFIKLDETFRKVDSNWRLRVQLRSTFVKKYSSNRNTRQLRTVRNQLLINAIDLS